MSYKVILCK